MIDLPKSFVYQVIWDSLSGSSNFARHYFRNRCYFLFLTLLRYFNSGGLACFRIVCLLHTGFAHSDSHGSLLTYSSPWRFAVRRVLLRHLVPRHPLCALFSLTFFLKFTFLCKFLRISNSTKFYLIFKDLFNNSVIGILCFLSSAALFKSAKR